ncbi:MAG: pirin family protein [Acidobacteria bacterium]|nr:pirin family protein [Acidobacteriota bacterium]
MISPDLCIAQPAHALLEALPARHAQLGALDIRRALPRSARRMVGPWCFLDRYGPITFREGQPMDLAPHPHIGLQTVSFLLEGEVLHRDSLGSEALLRAGGLNLMTAGHGIAHSEDTPMRSSGRLSGLQLWIALPEGARQGAPAFEHHPALPIRTFPNGEMTILLGEGSPATTFSPVLGADVIVRGALELPLDRTFEHALLVTEGTAMIEGQPLVPDVLYYLGTGRDSIALDGVARFFLLGGAPFGEPILMWWNFVARTQEEIVAAAEDWARGDRFGLVRGYDGKPMPAPPLKGRVRPPAAS